MTAVLMVTAVTLAGVAAANASSLDGYGTPTLVADGRSGRLEFDPSLGMPDASVTVGAGSASVQSGSSTWLSAATPFGAVFGSSRNLPYLRIAVPGAGSSITIEFEDPTPLQTGTAGWGFALGDVDAESVTISATGPSGALSAAQLGWSANDGGFNYCAVSPRPSICRAGSGSDLPRWNATTATLEGNIGNPAPDTDGAAGWFRPSTAVTSLTLTATVIAGIPNFQLWFAAMEDVAISGKVERSVAGSPAEPAPGMTLRLLDASGSPVLEDGEAVTTETEDDGTYAFGDLQQTVYRVALVLPDEADPGAVTEIVADLTNGAATGVDFVFSQSTAPVTEPEPEPEPEPAPDPETGWRPDPDLPATGAESEHTVLLACVLLVLGVAVRHESVVRRPRGHGQPGERR